MSKPSLKFKIKISYDGTGYSGWQIQPTGLAIQEVLQNVLSEILQEKIALHGAGRTDAGVHAKGQVAHFSAAKMPRIKSINSLLPADIRVLSMEECDPDFHARFSAIEKTYTYRVDTAPIQLPFERRYGYHFPYPIDLSQIEEAIPHFIGKKDFRSFANERGDENTVRTIFALILKKDARGFTLFFRGDGFLYKMVRNITGTLLDVGRGKFSPKDIPLIFSAEDRCKAGQAAPPHGLTLQEILYTI